MTLVLPRRRFLSLLGLGAAAAGVEVVSEPVRKLWFVGRNAPVGRSTAWLEPMLKAALGPAHGLYKFEVTRAAYPGGMVALQDDGTVTACRYGSNPIGVVQSVEPDGTAWVRLGEPSVVGPEVERARGAEYVARGADDFERSAYGNDPGGFGFYTERDANGVGRKDSVAAAIARASAELSFITDSPLMRDWLGPKRG